MSKKKKTRKDKERAQIRRSEQYKSILTKISDSHNDNIDNVAPKEQVIIGNIAPTPDKAMDNSYIKKDLLKVLELSVMFIIIIGILLYFDNKYNFLHELANNLINFLTQ